MRSATRRPYFQGHAVMARFALAWELHGGADHLSPLARLARSLVERGHQVDFILRDLGVASAALGELMQHPLVALWPAPIWQQPSAPLGQPTCNSVDHLMQEGYASPSGLLGLATGWRTILQALDPDLLVADHAPTALLAARGLRFPCVQLESCAAPIPVPPPQAVQVLNSCNTVLAQLGQPPLTTLHELLGASTSFRPQSINAIDQLIALSQGPQRFSPTPVHPR